LSKDNKDFRFQRSPRPDQPDHGAPEQSKKIEHHQPASADSPALASRFGFATGTRPFGCSATCCGWSCRVGATVKHAQPVGWTALTCDPRRQDDGERQALPPPPSIGKGRKKVIDRDRGTPRGAAPPTPPGIRVAYHGGSTGLSFSAQCRVGAGRERRRHGCAGPFEPPDVLTFARTPSVNRQRPQQGTSGRLCGAVL